MGTRLDRQDPRLQLHAGRKVRIVGLGVVLAGAVGEQGCLFLGLAMFAQAVPRMPGGITGQPPPVELPVGVALDEVRGPAGPRGHADAAVAVGVAAGEDRAALSARM